MTASVWQILTGNLAVVALFVLGWSRSHYWLRFLPPRVRCLLLSTGIEIAQYSLGRVADIDDIILNTTGALAGGLLGALISVMVLSARRRAG